MLYRAGHRVRGGVSYSKTASDDKTLCFFIGNDNRFRQQQNFGLSVMNVM